MKVEILTALTQQAVSPAHLMEMILETQGTMDRVAHARVQTDEARKAYDQVSSVLRRTIIAEQGKCQHRATEFHQGTGDMESYHRCLICDKALTDKPVLLEVGE